jgi:uroporphyrinogen-III decarboxylase
MTSRQRVLASFAHEEPDRVPCWFGSSDEFMEKASHQLGLDAEGLAVRFGDDFRRVHARYTGPDFALSEGAKLRTIFGVERKGPGYGQPMNHPLENADVRAVHDYPWPDPEWMDVSTIRAQAMRYEGQYAILGGDWSPFWHDAMDLFGMEELYVKMYMAPEVVEATMQHLVDYYFEVSRRIFDEASDLIDVFFIGNDFGGQQGPLLGLQLFSKYIVPGLRGLIDLGHSYGLKVQLHCCGGFAPLIPTMIDAGLDALHAVQPSCVGMDLAQLKEQFGDRMVFNGGIDSHHVLIEGTPKSVRTETRKVLKTMMAGGGYIAGASHDTILEETPVDNVVAMFDAIREFGSYGR